MTTTRRSPSTTTGWTTDPKTGSMVSTTEAPSFLSEPLAVIAAAVTAVDPALVDAGQLESLVVRVVDDRNKQRRLARALHEQPELLTSGRPAGPRQTGELVDALLEAGGTGFVRHRCAHCDRARPLAHIDPATQLRICGSCSYKTRDTRADCTSCGRRRAIAGRDHDGNPHCRRCWTAAAAADPLARIVSHLTALDTGLDEQTLREIAAGAAPRSFQQLRLAQELDGAPTRPRDNPTAGSHRLVLLTEALHDRGATGINRPACSGCGTRSRSLRFVLDQRRCCRTCYDAPRRESCVRCHRLHAVVGRDLDGGPLCSSCTTRDPVNHEICVGCARLRPVVRHDETGAPWCHSCWRGIPATCAFCGEHKPCRAAGTDRACCEHCARKQRTAVTCHRCGHPKPIWTRTADGDPLCNSCSQRRAPCASCGKTRRIQTRTPDGGLCRPCWKTHPDSFSTCSHCGAVENLHHFGLCLTCAARQALHRHLAGSSGDALPEPMEPVFRALVGQDPFRLVRWLESTSAARIVADLAAAGEAVTHAALDLHLPDGSVQFLRAALVNHGVLDPRDERLALLEHWLGEFCLSISDDIDRKLLRGYAIWHHLRRLRTRSTSAGITEGQLAHVKSELRAARTLLDWLHHRGRELKSCTQEDIDLFLVEQPVAGQRARGLLTWACAHHYAPAEIAIAYRRTPPSMQFIADDDRWRQARRLMHDDTIPTIDRLAGLLLLLYAQTPGRISRLRLTDILEHDGEVQILLGDKPLDLPHPIDAIARDVLRQRTGRFILGHHQEHPWLIPGGTPGRHMSAPNIARRLKRHGIAPREARSTALIDLAAQLPAAVVSQLLGLNRDTASRWAAHASAQGLRYAPTVLGRRR